MERIDRRLRLLFILSLVSSVLFVAGIPMIILGALHAKFVMVLGIVFTAADFYAMPMLWVAYGNARANRRLVYAVTRENLLTVPLLAVQLNLPAEQVRERLTVCIQKLYLTGYFFDGETLTLNTRTAPSDEILVAECESCGARLEYHPGETPTCPYCGTVHRG